MTRTVAAAAVVVVCWAAGAGAEPMIQRGSQELSLHLSPDIEGAVGDMLDLRAGYAYFVRDRLSARAMVSYQVLEDVAGEDADYRSSEIGLAAEYHFGGAGRLVPYLGAGGG